MIIRFGVSRGKIQAIYIIHVRGLRRRFFRSNAQRRDQGERGNFDVRPTARKDSKKTEESR